ncbi:MAG TPA: hypothetical protein V6D03_06915, partial [Candidatus Caenarcaniphilales bacterium]
MSQGCSAAQLNEPHPVNDPMDYRSIQALPQVWAIAAQQFEHITALKNPHGQPPVELTYRQLHQQIRQFAAGLQSLGIKGNGEEPPPRVAL